MSVNPSRQPETTFRMPSGERIVQLVREYQDRLRSYLASLGCRGAQVDDLVQDTFVEVLERGFEERGASATSAYLRSVARHRYLKSLRVQRRRVEIEDWDSIDAAWSRFEGDDGSDAYMLALDTCLETLSERSRDALHMRYGTRLSRAEIGGRLGMAESGVQSLLIRARKRLRECIERRLER